MSTFKLPELDLSRFPIPTQPVIGGKAVDSTANDKHALVSSVNDAVIITGLYNQTRDYLNQLTNTLPELQWSNAKDVDLTVEAAGRGYDAWQAMSRVIERGYSIERRAF